MIVVEPAVKFLGLGVTPPAPSRGSILADGPHYPTSGWWIATAPGVALMVSVLGINPVGDSLRDTLDPNVEV